MKKALPLGILASFFFAFTFILNRSMNLAGGSWLWSAPLRYMITLPLVAFVLLLQKGQRFRPVLNDIKKKTGYWVLWSTVGFGLFYLPLTLASVFGAAWMTAASWELTIVAGILLTPLFGKPLPKRNLLFSCLIVLGVFVIQIPNISSEQLRGNCIAIVPILVAAFSYPLGNRKMMAGCDQSLDTFQRLFGMLLCSLPFWLLTASAAWLTEGTPSISQLLQSCGVALFSGVIATSLFFHATDLVRNDPGNLAVIEATQCGEVVFTLLGGVLILGDSKPGLWGLLGLLLIIFGMIANALSQSKVSA